MGVEKIRKGNDIEIIWEIYLNTNGEKKPYILDYQKLSLYLTRNNDVIEVKDFEVKNNTISFTFYGKEQKMYGSYFLTLVEKDGEVGMRTLDSCPAFYLTPNSCGIGADGTNPNVQIVTLKLEGDLSGGAKGEKGDTMTWENSTEAEKQDMINRLRKSLSDAILISETYSDKQYEDYFLN